MALQESDEKVPTEASPETTKQGGIRDVEGSIEEQHVNEILQIQIQEMAQGNA